MADPFYTIVCKIGSHSIGVRPIEFDIKMGIMNWEYKIIINTPNIPHGIKFKDQRYTQLYWHTEDQVRTTIALWGPSDNEAIEEFLKYILVFYG